MTLTTRHIEFAIPKKTLQDLLASHLYAMSYANDDEDIEIEFKADHLRTTGDKIPITITLRKEERDNGA